MKATAICVFALFLWCLVAYTLAQGDDWNECGNGFIPGTAVLKRTIGHDSKKSWAQGYKGTLYYVYYCPITVLNLVWVYKTKNNHKYFVKTSASSTFGTCERKTKSSDFLVTCEMRKSNWYGNCINSTFAIRRSLSLEDDGAVIEFHAGQTTCASTEITVNKCLPCDHEGVESRLGTSTNQCGANCRGSFRCKEGWFGGRNQAVCQADGTWSAICPLCQRIPSSFLPRQGKEACTSSTYEYERVVPLHRMVGRDRDDRDNSWSAGYMGGMYYAHYCPIVLRDFRWKFSSRKEQTSLQVHAYSSIESCEPLVYDDNFQITCVTDGKCINTTFSTRRRLSYEDDQAIIEFIFDRHTCSSRQITVGFCPRCKTRGVKTSISTASKRVSGYCGYLCVVMFQCDIDNAYTGDSKIATCGADTRWDVDCSVCYQHPSLLGRRGRSSAALNSRTVTSNTVFMVGFHTFVSRVLALVA